MRLSADPTLAQYVAAYIVAGTAGTCPRKRMQTSVRDEQDGNYSEIIQELFLL